MDPVNIYFVSSGWALFLCLLSIFHQHNFYRLDEINSYTRTNYNYLYRRFLFFLCRIVDLLDCLL